METPTADEFIALLRAAGDGSRDAVDRLLPVVYEELRGLANNYLRKERFDHTLQPTALVHEAYLRLVGQRSVGWSDKAQFFGAAATVMRRILVDHARAKKAAKRGGDQPRTPLDEAVAQFEERAYDLVALNEALEQLGAMDERKARIVELRFFGGLTVEETSNVLDVPIRTLEREWALARAWLRSRIDQRN